jgi:hypothetical protein
MMTTPTPEPDSPSQLERLLDIVQFPVRVAQQGLGVALILCIANLVSASWLTFWIWHTFHSPIWLLGLAIAVLTLPAWVIGRLYFSLLDVCGLTDQVSSLLNNAKAKAQESHALITANLSSNVQPGKGKGFKLSDLFSLGGHLLEIKSFGDELLGLTAQTGSMMLLANPLFLGLCAIAIILTLGGILISAITLILFRW